MYLIKILFLNNVFFLFFFNNIYNNAHCIRHIIRLLKLVLNYVLLYNCSRLGIFTLFSFKYFVYLITTKSTKIQKRFITVMIIFRWLRNSIKINICTEYTVHITYKAYIETSSTQLTFKKLIYNYPISQFKQNSSIAIDFVLLYSNT